MSLTRSLLEYDGGASLDGEHQPMKLQIVRMLGPAAWFKSRLPSPLNPTHGCTMRRDIIRNRDHIALRRASGKGTTSPSGGHPPEEVAGQGSYGKSQKRTATELRSNVPLTDQELPYHCGEFGGPFQKLGLSPNQWFQPRQSERKRILAERGPGG